eukprot:TRINITY_DN2161_c0_g1_i1.p1 TRINITY_DN2161_c0_g1~~TRINITY_DN2161_c0_g1_i1.p1  ORF type:complete len:165 (-),score=34.22 TRINITY_DN2161_c0_g1_i1:48-542(-)
MMGFLDKIKRIIPYPGKDKQDPPVQNPTVPPISNIPENANPEEDTDPGPYFSDFVFAFTITFIVFGLLYILTWIFNPWWIGGFIFAMCIVILQVVTRLVFKDLVLILGKVVDIYGGLPSVVKTALQCAGFDAVQIIEDIKETREKWYNDLVEDIRNASKNSEGQ